jgi:serine phosphatase RsbU (regulator of sigma subunit)
MSDNPWRVLSTTAQTLAQATSLNDARACLRDSMEALFGEQVTVELIVGDDDLTPDSCRGLTIPLVGSTGNVGVIVLHGVETNETTTELVKGLAAQFAMAVQRLRPATQSASVSRMRVEFESGKEMQQLVLPSSVEDAAFQVGAFYQPFFHVAGDFYEIVSTEDGKLTILVADASGKGVAAALLMMRLVGEFRVLAQNIDDPAEILNHLNTSLQRSPAGDGFVTMLCAHLSRFKSSVSIANAGHVLPLLLRSGVISTACEPSPPLGMLEVPSYVNEQHLFEVGDMLFMMTDGVSEAFELHGAAGLERMHAGIREADDEKSACEILRDAWSESLSLAGRSAFDDATLVVVRHTGTG